MSWRHKSYDELPALAVRRGQLRQSLRVVTVAWMYGVVWATFIGGDQMRSFCVMLGFNDREFGLMGAIPYLATLGQLAAAVLVERSGLRKYQFVDCTTLHRLLWLVIAIIPLVSLPRQVAVNLVLVVMLASHLLASMGGPAWWTWMSDLIPKKIRGRYFANRTRIATFISIVFVVVMSVILDKVSISGRPETQVAQPMLMWTICAMLILSTLCGVMDILLFRRIREVLPPIHSDQPARPSAAMFYVARPFTQTVGGYANYLWRWMGEAGRQLLVDPLKNRVFRNYALYGATITFSMTVSTWYYWRTSTEWLGFSKLGSNVLFLGIGPLAGILTTSLWGKLIDTWGRKPVLSVATILTMASVVPWLIATRETPAPTFIAAALGWASSVMGGWLGNPQFHLMREGAPVGAFLCGALGCILGGTAWTGVNLAQTSVMLGFGDGEGRSKFVAASAVIISIGGTLGGVIGGDIAQRLGSLQHAPLHLGPLVWCNWHITILAALVFRVVSLFWLHGMPDPGARPVMELLRYVGANAYNAVFNKIFYPLRVFGWSRHEDEADEPARPPRRRKELTGSDGSRKHR